MSKPDRNKALRAPTALVALALVGCAPEGADEPPSARVRNAPPPQLSVTSAFDAPLAEGREAAVRLAAGSDALAARAAALRTRGATLSRGAVVEEVARDRLEKGPRPPLNPETPVAPED